MTALYRQGTVALGPDYAGLTGSIGYRLVAPDGTVVPPGFATEGVAETTIAGDYAVTRDGVRGLPLPAADWAGTIVWGTATVDLAEESVGPPPWQAAAVPAPAPGVPPAAYTTGTTLGRVYCTDEDIALRAVTDYPTICPDSQVMAAGRDGVFAADSPWVLTSATEDFAARGVHPRQVVWLTQPTPPFSPSQLLAVEAVAPGALTLRRLGQAPGVGLPPGVGGVVGVKYQVQTFDPQIDAESYETNRRFGVDPLSADHRPEQINDPRALQQYCVLRVLVWAYGVATKTPQSSLDLHHGQFARELEALDDSVRLRWGPRGQSELPTSAFGARTRR